MSGNWNDIDFTLPAGEAFVKAIREKIMTCHENKFQVNNIHLGYKANYSGYSRASLEDVVAGNGIVTWCGGFSVIWPNVFWDDRTLPIKKIPIWELDAEQRAMYDSKLAQAQRWIIYPTHWKKVKN
jgi:hypothetical protein